MTALELAKRTEKSIPLKVVSVGRDQYYVESAQGKICYRVTLGGEGASCTCGDYTANRKNDSEFICKHILAAMNGAPRISSEKPKLDDRFISNIKGKDFVLYSGLLDLAHQIGVHSIKVNVIQFPTKDNGLEAICQAVVESKNGEEFVEWGDANPKNVNKMIKEHILRMACTRSKARALRDFTNIGITCLEELGDVDDVIANKTANATKRRKPAAKPVTKENNIDEKPKSDQAAPAKDKVEKEPETVKKDPPPQREAISERPQMSEAQKKAILNLSKRRGVSMEELESMSETAYGVSLESLSSQDASGFIRNLQQIA